MTILGQNWLCDDMSITYILMAKEGFRLSSSVAYPAGIVFAAALFALYAVLASRNARGRGK